jgi:glutamine synthetase
LVGCAVSTLAQRAGVDDAARQAAMAQVLARVREEGLREVRIAWGDLHGSFRGKTLIVSSNGDCPALSEAFADGIGLVGTVLMKDSSDRTVYKVFEPGAAVALPALRGAANLQLLPDPASFQSLPWAPHTGWLRATPLFADGSAVAIDPRGVLQRALARLAERGLHLRCGLEVEFHIYRIVDDGLAAEAAAWPSEPPAVRLLHPGYKLLAEEGADMAHEALAIVRDTALALGLPLRSLEIELGPSQFEAVFDATGALTAADHMLLFRNATRQALRRAGYHASFVCKPPLPHAIASGWHLHHSVVDGTGANAFVRATGTAALGSLAGAAGSAEPSAWPKALPGELQSELPSELQSEASGQAREVLSDFGTHWLAGLLAHANGMAALCAPTLNAYSRYQGSMMAPQAAVWGRDNRGAMLRVVGEPGDAGTRIENRLGEPMANPYLMMAAQVWAGLDGVERALHPGPATVDPYSLGASGGSGVGGLGGATSTAAPALPTSLPQALDALAADGVMQAGLGPPMAQLLQAIQRQACSRFEAATDRETWLRCEYFGRY